MSKYGLMTRKKINQNNKNILIQKAMPVGAILALLFFYYNSDGQL